MLVFILILGDWLKFKLFSVKIEGDTYVRFSLRSVSFIRHKLGGREVFLEVGILMLILSIAFIVRVLPIRWGVALSEFDPWVQFKEAKFIIDRGWGGFAEFFEWRDTKSWYPEGRDMAKTAFPGLPFSMAFIYNLFATAGVRMDPLELASLLPVVYGVVSVLAVYLIGRDMGGVPAGLAAGLFLAVNSAHIGRTHLGWFDDESFSIPLMLIGFLLFMRAIREDKITVRMAVYSLFAGLSLGLMAASWGAHKFPLAFIPLFSLFLALIGRYRTPILASTAITYIVYTLIAISVPKLSTGYLFSFTLFSGLLAIVLLALFEIAKRYFPENYRILLPFGIVAAGVVGLAVIILLRAVRLPSIKFLSVVIPGLRDLLPIVESVAENQISTWASLLLDLGLPLLLVPMGVYLMLRRRRDYDLFMLLFTVLSIYFASSMVRLSILAAPAVAVTAGFGFAMFFENFGRMLALQIKAKRRGASTPLGYGIVPPLLILLLLAYSMIPAAYGGLGIRGVSISPIDQGYQPVTIYASSVPVRGYEESWMRALTWMRDNLPPDAVVAAWWDYGYWITIIGNKTTLIDNATLNTTKIGEIAYAFMSNETTALGIFRKYDVTHVAIFVTHQPFNQGGRVLGRLLGFGEESKWIWMARIAAQVGYPVDENELHRNFVPTDAFWETLLGKMIPFKPQQIGTVIYHVYQQPQLENFRLVYSSSPPYQAISYVYIYEVIYPEELG